MQQSHIKGLILPWSNQRQLHATSLNDKKRQNESENRPDSRLMRHHETGCSMNQEPSAVHRYGRGPSPRPHSAPFELDLHQHHRRIAVHLNKPRGKVKGGLGLGGIFDPPIGREKCTTKNTSFFWVLAFWQFFVATIYIYWFNTCFGKFWS